ncbi:hypothetical protein F5144DRAFT_593710 [Chaetomium tenue]|uniref:Uncharacterized protein n=1 Tax=Chaetomium tenue TaxID=1854479 RepID=A0ACB7P0Q2_9PEZI|nr:hypothetical protein F5144DRAFT_593710 [Chaetomium globosum]
MARSSITLDVPYIKATHKKPYPTISPLRPELSQAGRTVVIVGGSAGIGFAIARAFVQASSSHVILTGRRESALASAVSELQAEANAGTTVSSFVADLSDLQATERLWDGFAKQGIEVDVLVLNAMTVSEGGPLVQTKLEGTWKSFETNVRGLLDYSQRFSKQGKQEGKFLVNVSTSSIHNFITDRNGHPIYGLTKNSGSLLMQLIADDADPKDMQVINFHPGGVLTPAARTVGFSEDHMDWDDGEFTNVVPGVRCAVC